MMKELRFEEIKNNSLLCISWGDDWERIVSKQLFIKHLSKLRGCQNKEEFLSSFAELELKLAYAEGIRLLARKAYFKQELEEKLFQKGLSEKAVSQAIFRLEEQGYLDDQSRIQALIHRELKKGHGPQVIYQMLERKNIGSDAMDASRSFLAKEERQSLQAYMQKCLLKHKFRDRAEHRRLITQLLRRGYSYGAIRSVLEDHWQN